MKKDRWNNVRRSISCVPSKFEKRAPAMMILYKTGDHVTDIKLVTPIRQLQTVDTVMATVLVRPKRERYYLNVPRHETRQITVVKKLIGVQIVKLFTIFPC